MTTDVVWMTSVALDALKKELAALTTPARELDRPQRARFVELQDLVRRAQVERKPDDGLVEPGMRVTVRSEDDGSSEEFIFGSRAMLEGDTSLGVQVYSPESPLGAAINGLYVGDTVVVGAPKGPRRLTIIKAIPVA